MGKFQERGNFAMYRSDDHVVTVMTENIGFVNISTSDGHRISVGVDLQPLQAVLAAGAIRNFLAHPHSTGLQRWATGGHTLEITTVIDDTLTVTVRRGGITLGADLTPVEAAEVADALERIAHKIMKDTDT